MPPVLARNEAELAIATLRICDASGRHSTFCQKHRGPDGNACRCWPQKAPLAMQVWDIRRRACIHTYKGHTKGVTHIRFSPDGRLMASGSQDGDVRVSHTIDHRFYPVCVGFFVLKVVASMTSAS